MHWEKKWKEKLTELCQEQECLLMRIPGATIVVLPGIKSHSSPGEPVFSCEIGVLLLVQLQVTSLDVCDPLVFCCNV